MIKRMLAMAAVGVLFGAPTYALTLTPASLPQCTTNVNSNNTQDDEIALCFGGSGSDYSLDYKKDVGGGESGSLSGSYETTFSNTATDPANALIEYISGTTIACVGSLKCILAVKDGRQTPAQYFFDLFLPQYAWNGMDDIVLTGFWPDKGAISNVSIWSHGEGTGDDDDDTDLPEPGSLALLGLGLLGLGMSRRRKA